MTKTTKRKLIVCLAFAFVLVLSLSAVGILSGNKAVAEEPSTNSATNFKKEINRFSGKTINDSLFTDNAENKKLWLAYQNAKTGLADVLPEDKTGEDWEKAYALFQQVDALFQEAYSYVARTVSQTMQNFANAKVNKTKIENYAASKKTVEALKEEKTQLETEQSKYLPFIVYLSNNWEYLTKALELIGEVDAQLKEIDDKIKEIQFYSTTSKQMVQYDKETYEKNPQELYVVIASRTSIKAVKDLIDKLIGADEESFGIDEASIKSGVTTYAVYESAVTELDKLDKLVEDTVNAIDSVYDRVKKDNPGALYYTLGKLVSDARAMYDALNDYTAESEGYKYDPANGHYAALDESNAENFNDLQGAVQDWSLKHEGDTPHAAKGALAALEEMRTQLGVINGAISGVETAIQDMLDTPAEYNETYKGKIDAARDAFNKLNDDITSFDKDTYDKATEPTGVYGKVGEEFELEKGETYIVKGYDELRKAEAKWAQWEIDIDDLVALVEALVTKYNTLIDNPEYVEGGKEPEHIHPAISDELTAIRNRRSALTPEQLAAFNNGTDYKGTATDERKVEFEEATPRGQGKKTCKSVLDYFEGVVNEALAQTSDLNNKIAELYNSTLGASPAKCVFPARKTLLDLLDQYNELDPEVRQYVSNRGKLEAMEAEYNQDKPLVEKWAEAVKAIVDETKITVANWNFVDAAEAEFNKLLHTGETVPTEGYNYETHANFGKLQTALMTDSEYGTVYTKYETAIKNRNELRKAIDEVVTKMGDLDVNPNSFDKDHILDEQEWVDGLNAVTEAYKALVARNQGVTDEWMGSNHQTEWDNYQTALENGELYLVEIAIYHIYHHDEVNVTVEQLTLADEGRVNEAGEKIAKYKENNGDDSTDNIRNYSKDSAFKSAENYVDAKAKINQIYAELNKWMTDVVHLVDSEFTTDEKSETLVSKQIKDKIAQYYKESVLDEEKFPGYPLNLETVKTLDEAYTALTAATHSDSVLRGNAMAEAKQFFDDLKKMSSAVIQDLKDRIGALVTELGGKTTMTTKQITEFDDIVATYNKLHPTQQALVDNYNQLEALEDVKAIYQATVGFEDMLKELYTDVVTNKNVTSLTQYYIDAVRSIYGALDAEVRAAISDKEFDFVAGNPKAHYDDVMKAIQDAYDAAVKAGSVLALDDLKAAIDAQIEKEKGDIEDLEGRVKTLETAKETLEGQLAKLDDTYATDKQLSDAIDAAKKEIQDDIDEINTEIASINSQITAIKSRLDDLETSSKDYKSRIEALESNLDLENADGALSKAVKQASDDLASAKSELNKAIQDAQTALEAADKTLKDSIDKVASDLAAAKTDLQGKIDKLTSDLAAANKAREDAVKAVNDAVKALEDKMNAADNELSARLDKLNTTVTAVSVVFAVLLAGAFVCIVLLFIKKKA